MPAGLKNSSLARCGGLLLALLFLLPAPACSAQSLDARLAELAELVRFVPETALPQLLQIETQARAAALPAKAKFLVMLSRAYRKLGKRDQALALAEEVIKLARAQHDNTALARGLQAKAFVVFAMANVPAAHALAFEAERAAIGTDDMTLRIMTTITAGQSFAEQGDFPSALVKGQQALDLARKFGAPIPLAAALRNLAQLYGQFKDYDKGFAAIDEAWSVAVKLGSAGQMALVKSTEYALAITSKQPQRALGALQTELALERKLGAGTMIASTLVNLSDSYLKAHDYPRTLRFAKQALAAAQALNDPGTVSVARVNIGLAYLAMGRIADGRKSVEAGLVHFEKMGDKPELQEVLLEYGLALERAGDSAGAVAAYHRERALSDELFAQQRQKAVYELEQKYETDKKQRQIVLLSRENQLKSTELDNRRLQQRVWWLLAIVFALASMIVGLLYRKVRHANAQLKVRNLELKAQSSRDPLTSLYNRRHFQEFMRAHGQHGQLKQRGDASHGDDIVGALFLLDVDHFKHVNDTYGHAAGDAVLKMIAENLREIVRETDMIVRWGGEEFLAFLPAIPRGGLDDIARRILSGISAHVIDYQGSDISVKVSLGFAPFPLIPGELPLPWERAVNLVDMALYLAKAHGRNRAYGVRGFANFDKTSMEAIEQDLEWAWHAGFVDLSIVLGDPDTKIGPVSAPAGIPTGQRANLTGQFEMAL